MRDFDEPWLPASLARLQPILPPITQREVQGLVQELRVTHVCISSQLSENQLNWFQKHFFLIGESWLELRFALARKAVPHASVTMTLTDPRRVPHFPNTFISLCGPALCERMNTRYFYWVMLSGYERPLMSLVFDQEY
jgi:hypothetical protein